MLDVSVENSPHNQLIVKSTVSQVIEREFNPTELHYQETVFTLSNGYLGTRGTFEEGYPQDWPVTMIDGVYDEKIPHTKLVNCPNWLPLVVTVAGERFSMDSGEIIKYERQLDLRLGLVSRCVRWRSPAGHTLDFYFERFASLADQHILAIRCQITSIDFTGDVTVEVGFDPNPKIAEQHWRTLNQGGIEQIIWLQSQTVHSEIQLGMAAKLVVDGDETLPVWVESTSSNPSLFTSFQCFPGKTVVLEKIVTVFTSQDTEIPIAAALQRLADEPRYTILLASHVAACEKERITSK